MPGYAILNIYATKGFSFCLTKQHFVCLTPSSYLSWLAAYFITLTLYLCYLRCLYVIKLVQLNSKSFQIVLCRQQWVFI